MNFPMPDILPAYPELFLLTMACVILLLDLFIDDAKRYITYTLSIGTLIGCAFLSAAMAAIPGPSYTFNHMFVADLMGSVLKVFTCIAAAAVRARTIFMRFMRFSSLGEWSTYAI